MAARVFRFDDCMHVAHTSYDPRVATASVSGWM